MGRLRKLIPYWLRSGEQRCDSCGAPHAHAVEGRCVECDHAICPMCITQVGGEIFCPGCKTEEGGRKRWPRGRSGKAS